MTHRIAIVIGSTRPGRITGLIADWVKELLPDTDELSYEILDLKTVNLPFLDEPLKPALGRYAHEHTRQWSAVVSGYDGFIFVFPQYNWGYPAPLKNALDFLYAEWDGKPAALVTHGTRGGGRAATQLSEVLYGLHMQPIEPFVLLSIAQDAVDDEEQLVDADATLAPFVENVRVMGQTLQAALSASSGDAQS